jgi:hypothetical protein
VFDISPHQQQWLTNHLGHSLDVHKIHYRQTSGLIERVDISKLMLLTEYGLAGKYAGRRLEEITLEGEKIQPHIAFNFLANWCGGDTLIFKNDTFIKNIFRTLSIWICKGKKKKEILTFKILQVFVNINVSNFITTCI